MAEITHCGVCNCKAMAILLDMGDQPLPERDNDKKYPLEIVQCVNCSLVQLRHIVDEKEMFPPEHPYATGNTRFLHNHFKQLARQLWFDYLHEDDLVVDIGANDGTLLSYYGDNVRRVAVEPTQQIRKSKEGIIRYEEFFTEDIARAIRRKHGKAKVITATNVLAHVPRPHDFMAGVKNLLADDGIFVTENHDLSSITEGLQIDTVYHEHLRYYSVTSLSYLLEMHDLSVRTVEQIPTHGGSFRTFAIKQRRDVTLRHRAEVAKQMLYDIMEDITSRGERVYGIGAATRATPLIHYARIAHLITCICEVPTSEKIGQFMPGTSIPVVDEKKLIDDQPAYALLFSWHIASTIIPKLREAGYKGKFIVPLPEPRIIDG